ncbi:a-factor receptor [Marasmius tenuissimus]|uniref:A-factor receptor n=1 Tax=Marasmius tenuissimus TaxID=585030 RepID=A0ABR3A3H7_9AGAR
MPVSKDPTYPLFPILSCIGFFLCIIPLPWHIQARNSGTCAFMFWTAALCLVKFVDSIVWAGNIQDHAPVWCDIVSQVMLGATVGIPASALCISRRLYKITAIRSVSVTRSDKRRALLEDVAIALGIPIILLVLHIIVQPHRYDIFEDIGCVPVTYNTLPAYFLFFMWPLVIGSASFIYSAFNLRTFYVRRVQFTNLIATRAAMSTSHYVRLMSLAFVDILFTIPLASYVIYIGSSGLPLRPYISWEDTHFEFWRITQVPALLWRNAPSSQISVELNRWICVFCAFSFFALFGFANEAKKNYRMAFWFVAGKLGYRKSEKSGSKTAKVPVPKYHPMEGDSLPMYRVSDKKAHGTDTELFKATIDCTSSFGNSSTALGSPTASPGSPPSYEWPSAPTSPHDAKHMSFTSIHSTACRTSISSVAPSSPTTTLDPGSLAQAESSENAGTGNITRPDPVYLLHSHTGANTDDPPQSPPFSPVAAYHRPLSPDVYPISRPFGGF